MSVAEVTGKRPGKAAILRAAIEVIGEQGYDGATTRDMAARAGVSVAAVYYHFPTKLDLLKEFLDEAYDVILARLERRLAAADPSPEAQLDEIVGTLIAANLHDSFAQLASNVAFREFSRLDGAARAGVTVAAIYYHFPSKLDMLREFLDEAYDVILARLARRMAAVDASPPAQLDEIVGTLIASHLHDDYARLASRVAFREFDRLNARERKAIDKKRLELLGLVEKVIIDGIGSGDFDTDAPREAARAVVTLATSTAESYTEMGRPMDELIELYQGFARAVATSARRS